MNLAVLVFSLHGKGVLWIMWISLVPSSHHKSAQNTGNIARKKTVTRLREITLSLKLAEINPSASPNVLLLRCMMTSF